MASLSELFPPKPRFTEKNIPDQHGRVFIVTGGASGCGFEVAKALYNLNGRIYIAGRSISNAQKAIEEIKNSPPAAAQIVKPGKGELHFLFLDLADLSTIKASAKEFLSKEQRLDVIWHNAGVMVPPDGSKTKHGFDLQFGTNALGPFLFQYFLTPLCLKTASLPDVKPFATRVIFVSSSGHRVAPKPDGVNWDDINMESKTGFKARGLKYGQSKAMNVMHARDFARRYGSQGLIALSLHPGALKTNLQRTAPGLYNAIFGWMRYHQHYGGLTELFAGLNQEIDSTKMLEDGGKNGSYILPFGRFGDGSRYVFEGLAKRKTGERLWKLCEELINEYI